MKIAVGMSGGVDSSVTAYLLKQQGHEIVGVIMKIWHGGSCVSMNKGNACYGPDEDHDIEDARKVCDCLGVPLHVIDCSRQYEETVLQYFKKEYSAGRTPNPCVMCNHSIKFGVLPELLAGSGISFEKFATGHYARVEFDTMLKRYLLKKAADTAKDQTYFLYRLSQDQLARVIFPLGDFKKTEVRKIAKQAGLPVHDKEESQDFYSGDYGELLDKMPASGDIVDTNGKILGTHNGIWNYTIGQRKGLGIAVGKPLFVTAIDTRENRVVVGDKEDLLSNGLSANAVVGFENEQSGNAFAKIRSTAQEVSCSFSYENDTLAVTFNEPQLSITPGQSVVLYDNAAVLGGGIIEKAK